LKEEKSDEITIKNVSPKTTGGKSEVIDETFKSRTYFKEMEEGSISE